MENVSFAIWSFERGMYWKPNHNGYTLDLNRAGKYSQSKALEIVFNANIHLAESGKIEEALIPIKED